MMAVQQEVSTSQAGAFRLERRTDNVVVLIFDTPGERQNTLKIDYLAEIAGLLDTLERDASLRGVIIASGKPGSFIAGADIHMIEQCQSAEAATQLARSGQALFNRIEHFHVPVVAAIDGICLGGGLELALACAGRVCTDSASTRLGLPEVMLGLLPGSGGTQRLPRLIGLPAALDLMLTGRQLRPAQARRLGLVDDVVPASILLDAALKLLEPLHANRQALHKPASPWSRQGLTHLALEGNPFGRSLVLQKARQQTDAKTHGNYPAPLRLIDCVETGLRRGFAKGLEAEAHAFGELAMTAEARELIRLYFAGTELKKDSIGSPLPLRRVGVLGAGLMGAGISYVTAERARLAVRLRDKDAVGLNRGLQHIDQQIRTRQQRRALTRYEADLAQRRITPTLDYSGFQSVDLVIEAVFEDVDLKRQMLHDIEQHGPARVIFASNTSSIPIARIADTAARPERVVGMHYFSPVEKMPLLEVVATDHTAPEVIATAVDLGRKQGKTVIVVKDAAGFYVNRILAPYVNEAIHLLEAAITIDQIDAALVRFGFPVGPFRLLDEVGLDVVAKVAPILFDAFGERMRPAAVAEKMLADGRYGKKAGKGFYSYAKPDKDGRAVDESVYDLLSIKARRPLERSEIIDRCVLLMINEAVRCLDDGIIRSTRDGDIGAVYGIGFPPFRGGPFRYAERRGLTRIVERLTELQHAHGERYTPAAGLVQRAQASAGFY